MSFPIPITREAWTKYFEENGEGTNKPLYVDLGTGKGDFLIDIAKNNPENNYLGLEVRILQNLQVQEKILKENTEGKKLTNCWSVQGNATISIKNMFKDKEVSAYFIQFPDPWLKKKHVKRRMVKDNNVEEMYDTLKDDGVVYLITDVEEVFIDFCEHLKTKFKQIPYHDIDEKSHWEKWRELNNETIYRACFVK